jgi:hypothetical protein
MKRFYKALLGVFLLPALSYAQSNYKPGYVVNIKGDTLKGFIDYREWGANPDEIRFKSALSDGDSKTFTPSDISYFSITGLDAYQRYSGLISMDATDKDHLGYSRDTTYKNVTVFFKVLQKGKNVALYSYTDEPKTRFFIGEIPDYAPRELVYRLYYNYTGTPVKGQTGVTVNENTYQRQLFALANKYGVLDDAMQRDIERTDYKGYDLLAIVTRINKISKNDIKKLQQSMGPIYNLFVSVGANINHISTIKDGPYYQGGGRSQTSYRPAASFGIDFFASPSTRQLQFRIEAGIAMSRYNYLYNLQVDPYIPFRASFSETQFSISPQVIYNFYNGQNLKFFVGAGMSLSKFSYSNAYFGAQDSPRSASAITTADPFYFHKTDDTFLFKAGMQIYKNWGIFGQYSSGVAVSEGGYFQMSSRCEQIGVNYYFW